MPDADRIAADRSRLMARDPFALLINEFVQGDMQELEVIYGVPGTVLDNGVTFVQSEGVTAERMYSRIYTVAVRGHWLKRDVWVKKRGNSVWLYKYDPKTA